MRYITLYLLLLSCVTATQGALIQINSVGASGTSGGAIFVQYTSQPAGSGNLQSFVRIQKAGTEEGYNSDGRPVQFDEGNGATFNHSLQLSSVPLVNVAGIDYREFVLDSNESDALIILAALEIYMSSSPSLLGYSSGFGVANPLVYQLGAGDTVELDDSLGAGSGQGDLRVLIPNSVFAASVNNGLSYVYLYSRFTDTGGGFEEWAISGNPGGTQGVPEPGTLALLGGGLVSIAALRRRR